MVVYGTAPDLALRFFDGSGALGRHCLSGQFVNPYTFVPLPAVPPERSGPRGHSGEDPELLTGKLSVRIKAVSPLLIRGFNKRKRDDVADGRIPMRPDGTPFIPGSSLKGAVRSLHETLTGSCLRVFDTDFVPSYRESVLPRRQRRMAVVTAPPKDGRPPEIRLCHSGDSRKHRVHQDILRQYKGELVSGQRLNVLSWDKKGSPDKIELSEYGDWVLFLSDSGAREKDKAYRAHIRKLSQDMGVLDDDVWSTFLRVVEETDDRRTAQRERYGDETTADVFFEYAPAKGKAEYLHIGRRYRASPHLVPGQPVWVDVTGLNRISWIGLAMNWRHAKSRTSAGQRATGYEPCAKSTELCPSCRLFGSIDPNERAPEERAVQSAYRGHVRFGDALAQHAVTGEEVTLPPMGAPHPGAGQAYLDNRQVAATAGDPPLREWGSSADGRTPRRLRGRKHYWQAERNGREKAREHHSAEMVTTAHVFPEGTEFRATITFVDIDEAQLGGLLATLSPSTALDAPDLRVHIGGGKPLGFGQCGIEVDLEHSELDRSGSRYGVGGGVRDLEAEADALVESFRSSLNAEVTDLWPLVAKVLNPETVPGDLVWYPPGAEWAKRHSGNPDDVKEFDDGFEFWKRTSGASTSGEAKGVSDSPLVSLPHLTKDASETNQAMDIVVKSGEQDA
ncbi:CRISPR-associated protein (TIGR03986 family) [Saccharopolyspora erythraea NRRL 2338]|uniref:CRISPR type III-associated protein domain-containing protein n=2 Tax=Saccharopolyspora erythraea TaxID=1836 RepID=A0ABP3PIL2_SACER|nr:CRISPR-associated protein (TIGR03986 family) [Saccharopolyspora erythraea NRRL 2338]